jgi:hypothetical protein
MNAKTKSSKKAATKSEAPAAMVPAVMVPVEAKPPIERLSKRAVYDALGLTGEPASGADNRDAGTGDLLCATVGPFECSEYIVGESIRTIARDLDLFRRALIEGQGYTTLSDNELHMTFGTFEERLKVIARMSERIMESVDKLAADSNQVQS